VPDSKKELKASYKRGKVGAHYPKYFMMGKKVMTLDQVVNFCITTPMKGEALKWDDPRLTDLTTYVTHVKPGEEYV
jgi:cytochrome c